MEIPPPSEGVNAIGLARRDFSEDAISGLKEAYRTLYKRNLNRTQALQKISGSASAAIPQVAELIAFAASSSRGIIR